MESIDLSSKELKVASGVVIASLISSNTVTKTLKCAAMQHIVHLASMPVDAVLHLAVLHLAAWTAT